MKIDLVGPARRGLAMGLNEFAGFGALLAGVAADVIGLAEAMWLVASITLISGILAAVRMDETVRLSAA